MTHQTFPPEWQPILACINGFDHMKQSIETIVRVCHTQRVAGAGNEALERIEKTAQRSLDLLKLDPANRQPAPSRPNMRGPGLG